MEKRKKVQALFATLIKAKNDKENAQKDGEEVKEVNLAALLEK
jgi:hypothetical protein